MRAVQLAFIIIDRPAECVGDAGSCARYNLHQAAGASGGTYKALEETLLADDAEQEQWVKTVLLRGGDDQVAEVQAVAKMVEVGRRQHGLRLGDEAGQAEHLPRSIDAWTVHSDI